MPKRPGNPRWVRWLEDEGERRFNQFPDGHSHRSFQQAAKSLKQEQRQFAHPDQLRGEVKFVGEVMVSFLLRKLKARCKKKGLRMPSADDPHLSGFGSDSQSSSGGDDDERPAKRAKKSASRSDSDDGDVRGVNYDDDSDDARPAKKKDKGKGKGKEKEKASGKKTKDGPAGRAPKLYRPRKRSGAYAILVAFVKVANERGEATSWLTEKEIIPYAAPHSDASFTEKTGGNGNYGYTAFNNKKKLLENALITQKGRGPITYRITEQGLDMANEFAELEDVDRFEGRAANSPQRPRPASKEPEETWDSDENARPSFDLSPATSRAPVNRAPKDKDAAGFKAAKGAGARVYNGLDDDPPARTLGGQGSSADLNEDDDRFLFFYLTPTDKRTRSRALADTHIDPADFSEVFKVEFRKTQRKHDFVRDHLLDGEDAFMPTSSGDDTLAGWLRNNHAPDQAPGFGESGNARAAAAAAAIRREKEAKASEARAKLMGNAKPDERKDPNAIYKRPLGPSSSAVELGNRPLFRRDSSSSLEMLDAPPPKSLSQPAPKMREPVAGPSKAREPSKPREPVAGPSRSWQQPPVAGPSRLDGEPINPLKRSSNGAVAFDPLQMSGAVDNLLGDASVPAFNMSDAIVLRPGEFEVLLVVDHREYKMISELKAKGLSVVEEVLQLGDFIWVAKRKSFNAARPEEQYFVLDGILERKRLDDLISSIKDKRYDEQKARINKSGMTRRMYMIQMYDQKRNSSWEQQYWTVSSQSQVADGFTLAQVSNPSEAAAYVRRITTVMAEIHESTTLYGIPDKFVDRRSYLALQADLRKRHPTQPFLTTFAAFQSINTKQHDIKSGWANMLISQIGMSAEKVCDMVDRWPTPAALRKDIKREIARVEEAEAQGKTIKKKENGELWIAEQASRDDVARRGVQKADSTHLWHLFTDKAYPSTARKDDSD